MGSVINFLDDTFYAFSRVSKARKHVGALIFFWNDNSMPLRIKVKSRNAITLNLPSCGEENCSGSTANIEKYELIHHRSITKVLHKLMNKVKDKRIRSKTTREKSKLFIH